MDKIPILFVIDRLGGLGGSEKHLFELIKRIDRKRFKSSVCTFQQIGGESHYPTIDGIRDLGIEVHVLPLKRIYSPSSLRVAYKLRKIMQREKIKIVQTFHVKSDLVLPTIAKVCNVPIVISSRRDTGFNRKDVHHILQKRVNRMVDKIIVNSHAVKEAVIRKEGVSEGKLVLIYNGIDHNYFNQNGDTSELSRLRRRLGINSSDLVIGIVANFNPVKGHPFFIEAASLILNKSPNTKFLLVGEGPLKKEMEGKAQSLGIYQHTIFTGSQEKVRDLIAIMDISVNTSLTEGFSNAILEYMSMGKPVAATRAGGNPDIVEEGKTGFLVPPGDPEKTAEAVSKLIDNPSLAEQMGREGRKRVEEKFSISIMIEQMEKLYENLLAGKKNKDSW